MKIHHKHVHLLQNLFFVDLVEGRLLTFFYRRPSDHPYHRVGMKWDRQTLEQGHQPLAYTR